MNSAEPARASWLWVVLIGAASIALSRAFACATPFAALAAIAACTMGRREGLALVLFVWIANQGVGFGVLHYSRTPSTIAWGLAIGLAALASLASAWGVDRRAGRSAWLRLPAGLIAAFATYEFVLFAATWVLPSSMAAFAPLVVLRILAINGLAFALLLCADVLSTATGLRSRTHPHPDSRSAAVP